MKVYVFTGPTLRAEEGREVLEATYLPPATQGDVYRVAREKPLAIGLIDGCFATAEAHRVVAPTARAYLERMAKPSLRPSGCASPWPCGIPSACQGVLSGRNYVSAGRCASATGSVGNSSTRRRA
jgi:hypothetical protein